MQKFYSIFDKYYFYLLLLMAVFIPLYPKLPLLNVNGTYVAIRAEDFLIAVTFILWLIGNTSKLKTYFNQTIFQALLLFYIIGLISLISAIFITHSVHTNLGILHWLRRVEYTSLFIVAATSIHSAKQIRVIVNVLLFTALAVIVYGFGQIWLHFPVISTTNKEFSKGLVLFLSKEARVNSTFAGHYDLAIYLSIILMVITSLFFYVKKIPQKVGLALLGGAGFALLGFTAARVSFVATLAGLALLFWQLGKKILIIGLVVAALGVVAIVPDLRHRLVATVTVNMMGGGGPKYSPPPGTVTVFTPKSNLINASSSTTIASGAAGAVAVDTVPGEPINPTELGVYRSYGIRFDVEWPRALNAFYKNPFLGTGYSSINIATDNDFLRALGETGLLGTLTLILIFFILFKKMLVFVKKSKGLEKYFISAMICGSAVFLLTGTFIDALEASKVAELFWLILGLSWAVMTGYETYETD